MSSSGLCLVGVALAAVVLLWPMHASAQGGAASEGQAMTPAELELWLSQQIVLTEEKQQELLRLDRALEPVTPQLAVLFTGAGITVGGTAAMMAAPTDADGQIAISRRAELAIAGVIVSGMLTLGAGVGALLYRVRHRPHRDERKRLERQRQELLRRRERLLPGVSVYGALGLRGAGLAARW